MTYEKLEDIPADVAVSVVSGMLCCDSFDMVQQAGDFITGYPTYTHEYASEEFWERLKDSLITLYVDAAKARAGL